MSDLNSLLIYHDWANRETFASLQQMPQPSARALAWMAHLIAAEQLWLARIEGSAAAKPAVWPELSLPHIASMMDEFKPRWATLASDPAALQRTIDYRNSKGELWSSSVRDIIMHMVIHGAYHRGQIAAEVRATGGTPAYTDYIQAVRSGNAPGLS